MLKVSRFNGFFLVIEVNRYDIKLMLSRVIFNSSGDDNLVFFLLISFWKCVG